jgi:hypothetical protein
MSHQTRKRRSSWLIAVPFALGLGAGSVVSDATNQDFLNTPSSHECVIKPSSLYLGLERQCLTHTDLVRMAAFLDGAGLDEKVFGEKYEKAKNITKTIKFDPFSISDDCLQQAALLFTQFEEEERAYYASADSARAGITAFRERPFEKSKEAFIRKFLDCI